MLGHISGMISPREKKEENSHRYRSPNICFWGTALSFAQSQYFRFLYIGGGIKPLIYWAEIEREVHQHIFETFQISRNSPGTFEIVWHTIIMRVCECINSGGGYVELLVWTVTWLTINMQQLLNWERLL